MIECTIYRYEADNRKKAMAHNHCLRLEFPPAVNDVIQFSFRGSVFYVRVLAREIAKFSGDGASWKLIVDKAGSRTAMNVATGQRLRVRA